MQTNRILILAVAAALGGWYLLARGSSGDSLDYLRDWNAAVETARLTGKPILLNFGGPW